MCQQYQDASLYHQVIREYADKELENLDECQVKLSEQDAKAKELLDTINTQIAAEKQKRQ